MLEKIVLEKSLNNPLFFHRQSLYYAVMADQLEFISRLDQPNSIESIIRHASPEMIKYLISRIPNIAIHIQRLNCCAKAPYNARPGMALVLIIM